MRKEDILDLEFVEKYNMEKAAQAIYNEMDWSFIIKRIIEESDSLEELLSRVFKTKNTKLAYYLFKQADLTRKQKVNIILFLIQKNDSLRLIELIKRNKVSGGVLGIAIEMVKDFDSLYFISIHANLKELDLGQRNIIVDRIVKIANREQRKKFLRDVRWLSNDHKNKIYNA